MVERCEKQRGCTSAKQANSLSRESYWDMVFDSTMTSPKPGAEKNQPFCGVVDADRAKGAAYEMATSGIGNFFVI